MADVVTLDSLPRRERELFELVCRLGEATAAEIRGAMDDPPSYSAVRTLLSRLATRGLIRHRPQPGSGQAYLYRSVRQPGKVRESALRQMVRNFFDGSEASAATALLGLTRSLSDDEADALRALIDRARETQDDR